MNKLPADYKKGMALNNLKRLRFVKDIPDTAQADAETWIRSDASPFIA
jgi:hypothetical protein